MHVLARPALAAFAARHPQAGEWLDSWWKIASGAAWTGLSDVRRVYPSVDQVGGCLVFNKGNDFRLIVGVSYAGRHTRGTLFIKEFLTHAEYDRGKWKRRCGR